MDEVYAKRPQGRSNATKFNKGGTGFMHQFYLWSLVRALKPKHIIESGAYNGLGTWQLRQAAPDAQIIVLSPKTPHAFVDRRDDSRYFTEEHFRDFSTVDWACAEGLDRSRTVVFVDDHQSGYRRMLEAHARGFHHLMFDDNLIISDHFSVKGACAASKGEFHGLGEWDDFRGIKSDWAHWRHGQFNVSQHQLSMVGSSFLKAVRIYAEMPPLWSAGLRRAGWAAQPPALGADEARRFVDQHKDQLRDLRAEGAGYGGFAYVRTQPWEKVKPGALYLPEQVKANGYAGVLPNQGAHCDRFSAGVSPALLKPTKPGDDLRRNIGAGLSTRLNSEPRLQAS
uniref:Uncharacterized protein n=1 Tax=Calcidiscus leptoporus TaxID=127549 RepID=A0A7S0JKE1_9EUKA